MSSWVLFFEITAIVILHINKGSSGKENSSLIKSDKMSHKKPSDTRYVPNIKEGEVIYTRIAKQLHRVK